MSENWSDDDDDIPVFAFRADNIMKKQQEAYQEMLKKAEEEEDTAKTVEDEEMVLLSKIHEKLQKKPRGKKKADAKASETEEKNVSSKNLRKRKKKPIEENADGDNIKSKKEELSPINLSAATKKKLMKIDLENNMESKRIQALNRRALKKCASSSVDDHNISMDMETENNVTLKISYLSETSKITVSENDKFSSIISKVADIFKLKVTEVTLCLRDEIISFDETPHSLQVKAWEIIDCVPYKPAKEMQDDADSNKILIKMQSNDSKRKIDIYAHKLEKFQDIMERYAISRSLPLKDLIFEFDGETLSGSDTPDDLDMESGSCVDVKVIGSSFKPTKSSAPFVDLQKEESPHKMLDICVLD